MARKPAESARATAAKPSRAAASTPRGAAAPSKRPAAKPAAAKAAVASAAAAKAGALKDSAVKASATQADFTTSPGAGGDAHTAPVLAGKVRSVQDARKDLFARAALNTGGAAQRRSDPLADAKAVRAINEFISGHTAELARRGLSPQYAAVARELAVEIESHLSALPAAALAARGRSADSAELLADAAATAQAARSAVARVSRGPDGRRAAHAFGLGEPFNARQPAHVLRALERIVAAAGAHAQVAADIGLLPEDLQTMTGLSVELAALPGAKGGTDEASELFSAQAALRAFFDLVAAKATLALAGDPDERTRLLALLPRADERRHRQRSAEDARAS